MAFMGAYLFTGDNIFTYIYILENLVTKILNKHVCILGCGRSGTSIFGEFFDHLAHYTYYSEPLFSTLETIDYSTPVAIKVPTQDNEDDFFDGLSFNLQKFLQIFPHDHVLFWQVRHPLDAISSLRIGIENNWGHHPRPHDWKDRLSKPLLEKCAYHWNFINTNGYEQVKDRVVINTFEEMVLHPLDTAQKICDLTGIDFSQNEASIMAWVNRIQDENNEKFVEAECSRPYSRKDHTKKVGRWEENLSQDDIAGILPFIGKGTENFGYELPEPN